MWSVIPAAPTSSFLPYPLRHSCRTHSVIPTAVEGSQPVASGPFDTPKVIAITFSQTIKKATSFEAALSILVADRTEVEPKTYIV